MDEVIMPEQQFDAQALLTRVTAVTKELRKSEAYPAIVGGVAGGIAGALIAALIAGRRSSSQVTAPTEPAAKSGISLSLKDVMQLVTVVASLAKQVQDWTKKQDKK
jgi:hypothetical protein